MGEARDALTQARLEAQAANAELLERWEEINLLYSIGDILGRTLDLRDAAGTILAAISDTVGAGRGAIFVHDASSGLLRPLTVQGVAPSDVAPVAIDDVASLVARTYRARHAVLESSVPGDMSDRALRRGPVLAVPVMWKSPQDGAVALGVVVLSDKRSDAGFTASDEKLVSAIAAQIGTAIQIEGLVRASVAQQRLAHEMQLAHELQMRLLPATNVVSPEATCAARVAPAQSVGGDFYHLFRLSGGRTGVLIGDVSSHGYQAALIMALTMSAMAIHAQATVDPAVAVQALYTSLADELQQTEMFLSLCYAVIDPAARTLVLNVAATCAKCHSDAALLASRKLDDTGAEFAKSAHARALVQHGGEGAPTCTTCHGVHGADAPDAGEVDKMCGRCHGAERSAFLAGPHANALHQAGREACSACHGDHQSHEPGDAVSPAQCASCHAPMSQGALVGRRIGREWAAAERELAEAEKRVARTSRVPLNTEDHEQRLDEVRQHLAEARTAVHTATWEAAEEPLRQARTVTREVERDLEGRLNVLYMWRILLAVFVFYVIGTATLLRRMRDRGSRDAG